MREDFGCPVGWHSDELVFTDDFSSTCSDEDPEPAVDERETWRVKTSYTSETPTLYVVDYQPSDIMFKDTTAETLEALKHVFGGGLTSCRLTYEDFQKNNWKDKLGDVSMFPAFVLTQHDGVFRVHGSFLRKMYVVTTLRGGELPLDPLPVAGAAARGSKGGATLLREILGKSIL
jgi:hypothetical protein